VSSSIAPGLKGGVLVRVDQLWALTIVTLMTIRAETSTNARGILIVFLRGIICGAYRLSGVGTLNWENGLISSSRRKCPQTCKKI